MSVEISQDGIGNVALQDIENSTINISVQLNKSTQFNDLINNLNSLKDFLSFIPEDNLEKHLEISKKISDVENLIKQFKQDVLRLAETFNRIEINTERLIRAKELFDKGEIIEARLTLLAEVEQMQDEQIQLLQRRDEFEQDVLPKLKHSSEEFLVLAMATAFDYENPDRFSDTCKYFEDSIRSYETQYNLFLYAQYLSFHNRFIQANEHWMRCWNKFQLEMDVQQKVEILNNIALTFGHFENFRESELYFEQTLSLASIEAETKQTKETKSSLAYILNNFGLLLTNSNKNDDAEIKLKEALKIREGLVEQDSFNSIDNVGVTLLNLGLTFRNKGDNTKAKEHYIKALEIYEKLKEKNPFYSLQQLALILNNLGDMYEQMNEYDLAEDKYNLALEIIIDLLAIEPLNQTPTAIIILANLASFYKRIKPNKEDSVLFATDAMILALPLINELAIIGQQFHKARLVLEDWGMSENEILTKIGERMKFFEDNN